MVFTDVVGLFNSFLSHYQILMPFQYPFSSVSYHLAFSDSHFLLKVEKRSTYDCIQLRLIPWNN